MTLSAALIVLAVPVVLSVTWGSILLRRAFARPQLLAEEIALAAAWVFAVGSLFWLGVYLTDSTFLGFTAPWTWLAAAHFAFAGFGALTITSLSCRIVSSHLALKCLRLLLILHPVAYLVTAAGILQFRYCNEIGAMSYGLLFMTQVAAVTLGSPNRIPRASLILLIPALLVPLITIVPAIAWAWGHPLFNLMDMARYHGLVNAVGHVGLGLIAFASARPPSHSPISKGAHPLH